MTKQAQHTPGPWRSGDRFNTIFGPPNGEPAPKVIATVRKGHIANARLIAAAPELLAAARLVRDAIVEKPHIAHLWVTLDSAIAAAEGRDAD